MFTQITQILHELLISLCFSSSSEVLVFFKLTMHTDHRWCSCGSWLQ